MIDIAGDLLSRLDDVRKTAAGWQAKCPAHQDDKPSLCVSKGDNGGLLLFCQAGCATEAIVRILGLKMADLMPSTNGQANSKGAFQIDRTYDYRDEQGVLLFQSVRLVPKDFRLRQPDGNGGWTYKIKNIRRVLFRLAELIAAATATDIYVAEGEKDADNLAALGLVATTNVGGAGKWKQEYSEFLRGRNVVILPDNDGPGHNHAIMVGNSLAGVAASVKVIELPGLPEHGDISDFFDSGGTVEALAALVEAAPEWTPTGRATRKRGADNRHHDKAADVPTITITTDEPAIIDAAIAALAADPTIFKRGNVLACVSRDDKKLTGIIRPPDSPRIVPLPLPTLRERMAGNAKWIRIQDRGDKVEEVSAHPPDWAVKAVEARGQWTDIRPIEGIVETPILRPDGTILTRPGYDAETGLLYEPRCSFPEIAEQPTLDDAMRAIDALLEVVADFPFALDAHRSGWLAALLTPLTRYSFHGPAPMFTFDANTRGSGKTLAADAIGEIVCGWPMPRMVNPESDDETRKRITTLALEGERMILLDNLGNVLGCPSLDAALTATTWKDRVLGVNRSTAAVPLNATWYATGNNIEYNGDTIRRVVPIRIESDLEKPEERTGFRHQNLLAWIRQDRGRLIAAALTILRAYHVAGRPDQRLTTWGSYEAWSAAVREPIVWAGLVDPADAREELAEQSDREAGALRALLAGWEEIAGDDGMTIAEVFRRLEANTIANRIDDGRFGHEPLKWTDLRAAIAEVSGAPLGKLPGPRSFGMRLHHLRGRVVGGKRFTARDHDGMKVWRVETAAGTKGTKGTISPLHTHAPARTHAHAPAREERSNSPSSPSSPVSPREDDVTDRDWVDPWEQPEQ